MPIRFRCPHCQQLLGIARRKAGTKVECPTCRTTLLVPGTDQADVPALPPAAQSGTAPRLPAPPPPAVEEPLFERSDFEQVFAPSAPEPEARPPGPSEHPVVRIPFSNGPAPGEPAVSEPPVPLPAPLPGADWDGSAGYLLTPRRATILTVLIILLMAVAFLGGVCVGKYVLPQ